MRIKKLLLLCISFLFMVLIVVISFIMISIQEKQQLITAKRMGDIIGDNIILQNYNNLMENNIYELRYNVRKIFRTSGLSYIIISDREGKVLYHLPNDLKPNEQQQELARRGNESIPLEKDIPILGGDDGGILGHMKYAMDMTEVRSSTRKTTVLIIISALLFWIISVVTIWRLLSRVTNSLELLQTDISAFSTDVSHEVMEHSVKYSIKIKTGIMEVSKLVDGFNSLLDRLNIYHSERQSMASLAAIGQSTAMVAHDVRKPLASMKALLTALPDIKDNPAELKKIVAIVDRNISQTNTMLNDILEFSNDSTMLDLRDNNPSCLIISALGDALRNHQGSNVQIEYNLRHQYALRSDVARVVRVLTNVIDNALDAMTSPQTGKASGTLHFETYDTERDGVKFGGIVVRDSGPGIPSEALERIFDPFFTKGKKGGTGLGLAICHRVISLHGGTIKASNREEETGAKFVIELPLGADRVGHNESELIRNSAELEQFRIEEAARVDYGDTANTAEFLRINKERNRKSYLLIVDDEPLFRESIRATMNELKQVADHVKVVEADSAETAFPVLETREFDYVIADIDLGSCRMNGYDFAQVVLKKYPNTHVLIHSNKRKAELDIQIRKAAKDESRACPERSRRVTPAHQSISGGSHEPRFMGFLPKPMRAEELLQFLACKTFEPQRDEPKTPKTCKNVLIVNDDEALLFVFKIMLKAPDVQVLSASNVSGALKHISEQKVDVILSDINLGDGEPDGYELLKSVRETDKAVPFYMVSGYSVAQESAKAKGLGANGYLQLPVAEEQLRELL